MSHLRGGRYGGRGGGLTGGAGGAGFCRALSSSWYALGLKGALYGRARPGPPGGVAVGGGARGAGGGSRGG